MFLKIFYIRTRNFTNGWRRCDGIYYTGNALEIYKGIMMQSGGLLGILDLDGLESALAQPRMTFGGEELYPTIIEKATALGFHLS
jgi:prophage maintenance system killer protein